MRFSFLFLAAALPAAEPDRKMPAPAPVNLKFIDQGANDPKLKGYQTPVGFKLEIVAQPPAFAKAADGSRLAAIDRTFNAFRAGADAAGNGRLWHAAEAADFGKLPPMVNMGRGAPGGLLIYNDAGLPAWFRDHLWVADPARHRVRAYVTRPAESAFAVRHEFDLLTSEDPLFRPGQMAAGPDGAVYLWCGDGAHGRIYRLTWAGGAVPVTGDEVPAIARRGMDSWAKIAAGTDAELLKSLAVESLTDRRVAWTELSRRGEKNRAGVSDVFNTPAAGFDARAAALAVLETMWNDAVKMAVLEVFDETDGDLKRLAIAALARRALAADEAVIAVLIRMLGDHDPALQRAAALALAQLNPPGIAEQIVINVKTDRGADPFLTDGYLRALERLGKPGVAAILDLARSGNQPDRDRAIALFTAGRSKEMFAELPGFLLDPHLNHEHRAALIASATNYQFDPPAKMDDLLTAFLKIQSPSAEELAAVVTTLAETDSLTGEATVPVVEAALASDAAETRLAAVAAVERAKLGDLAPALLKALNDKARDVPERVAVLKALRNLNRPGLGEAVQAFFKTKPPAALQAEVLRTLAAVDPAAVVALATESLETADAVLQAEAVRLLGATPAGAKLAGQRFLDKKLSRELLPDVSEGLRRHAAKDADAGKLLTAVLRAGLLAGEPASVEQVRQLVLTKGDAGRGRTLYLNSAALACVTCHKMEGVGGQVGPDLTRLWDTMSIEKVIESMIDPSKEIKEGYQSYRLVTTKGRTHTGLKITETKADVTIREAGGADVRVPTAEIEELKASKVSLMPDNVVSQLSFDQFVDLVAFLKNRQAQEYLRQIVTEFTVRGPVTADATAEDILRLAPRTASAQPNGVLNLRPLFPAGDARAVVEILVRSPKEQTVQLIVGTDGPATLSLNHRAFAEISSPKPFGEAERHSVMLHEGWQTIWVDVKNRKDAFRLSLRALGQDLKIATKQD